MASIEFRDVTYDSFEYRITGLDSGYNNSIRETKTTIYKQLSNGQWGLVMVTYGTIPNKVSSTSYVGVYGLDPLTWYEVDIDIYNIGGYTGTVNIYDDIRTSAAPMPTLGTPSLNPSYTEKTNTTVTVRAYSVTGATMYYFEIWNDAKTSRIGTSTYNSVTAYFGGLTAGVRYQIRVRVTGSGYNDSAWSGWYVVTTTAVTGWNWEHSTRPEDPFLLKATEWKSFQDKINEIRVLNGLAAITFVNTDISAGKSFKASHVNAAINAINPMITNTMPLVTAGEEIKGLKMVELKDRLNSAI